MSTALTHAQIANIVKVVEDAIAATGIAYVNQNYPFFASLAAPIIQDLARRAAIAVVNAQVEHKVLP